MQILGDRVRSLREGMGLTQEEVAERVRAQGADLSQQQLATIEASGVKRPRSLHELADVLQTTPDYLLGKSDEPLAPAKIRQPLHEPVIQPVPSLRDSVAGSTLDVWETTRGGGRMRESVVRNSVVDSVARPDPLKDAKKALAFRILGDAMDPALRSGDIAYVDRMRPAVPGDDCLFARPLAEGAEDAYHVHAGHLLSSTTDAWHVRQFNPRRDYDLPRAEWPEAWKIQGKYSR